MSAGAAIDPTYKIGQEAARRSRLGPRQKLIDTAVWMAVDDLGDDLGEVSERVDAIEFEFAAFDQGRDHPPMAPTAIGAGEECILSIQRDGSDAGLGLRPNLQ